MDVRNPGKVGRLWLMLIGIVTGLAGIYFIGGGGWLAWLGGSWYFIIAGILLLVSGVLLTRQRLAGALFYGITLVFSLVWSLGEVGLQFWPLFSRLFAPAAGAVLIAFTVPLLTPHRSTRR